MKQRKALRVSSFLECGPLPVKDLCGIILEYSQQFEGALSVTLPGHTDAVCALAALPDGTLASGSWDHTIRVWRDGVCLRTLKGHSDSVTSLAVLPDGMLASGSDVLTVRVWENGVCLLILSHISHVKSLTVLLDGRLAVGLSDIVTVLQDGSRFMGPSDEAIYVYE